MKWEKLFKPHILERGYEYFRSHSIQNMEISSNRIRANVLGTEEYEVEILLSQDNITELYCSCPYAEEGKNCKHIAAVLYEWFDKKEKKDKKGSTLNKKKEEISNLLEKIDKQTINSFLSEVLMENEKLFLRFKNLLNENDTEEYLELYREEIEDIILEYTDEDNFINYYNVDSFVSELEDIIYKDILPMTKDGNYKLAFDILHEMFISITKLDVDDSSGILSSLVDDSYDKWLKILSKVKPGEKRIIFKSLQSNLELPILDYMKEYIEKIIVKEFREKEYREVKLKWITKKIEECDKSELEWIRNYKLGKWAIWYFHLLQEDKYKEEEFLAFCKNYWHNEAVRKYYIDFCIQQKDYQAAFQAIEESILLDADNSFLLSYYTIKKKEIFLLQGDQEAYVEQLWKLVMKYNPGNLEFFKELKQQYPTKEWLVQREKIFQRLSKDRHLAILYHEEKLYDRLLSIVVETQGIFLLGEYEKDLISIFPKQVLQKYERELKEMASKTGNRKQYRELVSLLRKMKKIKGGNQVVENICMEWKIQYKNRPAMMGELEKL